VNRLFVLTILASVATSCSSGTGVSALPGVARDIPDFEARLERLRGLLNAPGMQAAIGHNGAISWTKSFGLADVAGQHAVRDTTTSTSPR
jgi:hypothetical protein